METLKELLAALREEYKPEGAAQELLVRKIAENYRLEKLAARHLARLFEAGEGKSKEISMLLRCQKNSSNSFHEALTELRRIQKKPRHVKIDFIQSEPAPKPKAGKRLLEMPSSRLIH